MNSTMATKRPNSDAVKPMGGVCTEYHLHKSQNTLLAQHRNIIDYTYYKLRKYIDGVKDKTRKSHLEQILKEYSQGFVAIAWYGGNPTWVEVTKEN